MSLLNLGKGPQACPRCKMILPPGRTTCSQCGLQLAQAQRGGPPTPPPPGYRPSTVSPTPPPPGYRQPAAPPTPVPPQYRQPTAPPVPTPPQYRQVGVPPTPFPPGVPPNYGRPLTPPARMSSGMGPASLPGPMPAHAQAATTSSAPPAAAPRRGKEQERPRSRAAMKYFLGVFFSLILFAFLILHAAGVSPAALFTRAPVTPTPAYPVPKTTPLFADSFVSDAYGWNLESATGNYAVSVGNGMLTLEEDQHKLLWELLPGERTFSNFILTTDAELSQGAQNNGYGIYVRGTANPSSDLATYYRFELYGDGTYAVFKGTVDASGQSSSTKIGNYAVSPAIQKQGKVNHIMIIARGASISFIVNNQLLQTVTDPSYASGSVALFISNLPQAKAGAQAQFSQLAIYP